MGGTDQTGGGPVSGHPDGDGDAAAELWRWWVDGSRVGMAVVDGDVRFRAVNSRLAAINSLAVGDHLGRTPAELFPGVAGESMTARFRRVLDTGEPLEGVRISGPRTADGEPITVVADYFPVRDDTGRTVAAGCSIVDVTEQDQLERLLARTSVMMDSLVREAPVGVAFFDPSGRYALVNDALAEINGVPAGAHVGRTVREVVPHLADEVEPIVAHVLRTGEAVVDVEVDGETAARPGVTREWLATFYRVDAPDETVGVGCVVSEVTEERRAQRRLRDLIDGLFTFVGLCEPDGTLVEANRTALDAAGLRPGDVVGLPFWETYWWSHDQMVQEGLRAAVRRGADGQPSRYDVQVRVRGGELITIDFQLVPIVEDGVVTALVPSGVDITDRHRDVALLEATGSLTRQLSTARTTREAVDVILRSAGDALGSDFVNVAVVDGSLSQVRIQQPDSLEEGIADRYHVVPLDAPTVTTDAVRTGRTVVLRSADDHDGRYRSLYDDVTAAGLACITAVPLRSGDRTLGALGVGWRDAHAQSTAEQARLDTVAKLCAQTLDRAQRGDSQQEFLASLQTHLLPRVPVLDGLDVAVRYEPATDHIGFGGDWYDVVALDEHRTLLVVGDIVGHGIEAAARMSQVRGILVGLVEMGVGLDQVFARAARPLARLADGYLGTAAVAVVDTSAGTVEYACAGHPPPLLRREDGTVTALSDGRHTVLGLAAHAAPPGRADFPPGATLVLYTDGLIERRGEPVDDGIARLAATLADVDRPDAAGVLEHLGDVLLGGPGLGDDVATVIARRTP